LWSCVLLKKAIVLVRIGFAELDPRILPDMGVKVTFLRDAEGAAPASAKPVTLVPKAAVRTENGQSYVFVVTNNTVERVEVQAGLRSGERDVLSPPLTLAAGVTITLK
jgi:hypothetical protein